MTDKILQFLEEKSEVKITAFGKFYLNNSPAFYDEESAALLPPGKEVLFDIDYDLKDDEFTNFLAAKNQITFSESTLKIAELTNYWKKTLEEKHELEISGLGNFYVNDDGTIFKGDRFVTKSPDNFGLEKLDLSQLNKKSSTVKSDTTEDYKTSKKAGWWFLLIIPIAALLYFALEKPELVFGKKSFKKSDLMNTINKDKKVAPPLIIKTDSLKQDSTFITNP